jgi:hypothetical protein
MDLGISLEDEKIVFDCISKLLEDEQFQLEMTDPKLQAAIEGQPACDRDPEGTGSFGFVETNPIPVNGWVGELAYLSKLETVRGERIFFHRLGSIHTTDVFEAVTFSGSEWFILFVDMYYPRQSRLTPDGFRFRKKVSKFTGFHDRCSNFPYGFIEKQRKEAEKQFELKQYLFLGYLARDIVSKQLEGRMFERPPAHKAKLALLKLTFVVLG